MRILLLDDNPEALLVVERFLKAIDHTTSAFTDGKEALLWLDDVKPELILTDMSMPGLDGFDFVKAVRARSRYAQTPIIAVTGTDLSDSEILAQGFSSVLRKPVTLKDVMEAIEAVSETHRAEQPGTN